MTPASFCDHSVYAMCGRRQISALRSSSQIFTRRNADQTETLPLSELRTLTLVRTCLISKRSASGDARRSWLLISGPENGGGVGAANNNLGRPRLVKSRFRVPASGDDLL